MRPRQELPDSLIALAARQAGVLSAAQLTAAGVSPDVRRRFRQGWITIAPKLYLLEGTTFEAALWVGVLRGGSSAAISGAAACYLHGFLRDTPGRVTVWTLQQRSPLDVASIQVRFRRGDRRGRGAPSRTSPEVALCDLADESDETTTVSAVASALANRRTTPSRLLETLRIKGPTRHSSTLSRLVSHANSGIESALEWRFHTRVLGPHRLPVPRRQEWTHSGRVDGVYPAEGLFVELDGMRDHTNWSKDMWRDNEHALRLGAVTLRYGWWAVETSPCAVAAQLAAALSARGWTGTVSRCRACPTDSPV